jgi:hypothetical protein
MEIQRKGRFSSIRNLQNKTSIGLRHTYPRLYNNDVFGQYMVFLIPKMENIGFVENVWKDSFFVSKISFMPIPLLKIVRVDLFITTIVRQF